MTKTVGRPKKVSMVARGFKFGFGFMIAYAIYQIVAAALKTLFVIMMGFIGSTMIL